MKNCRFLQSGLMCLMVCLLSGCGRTKNELPVDLGTEPYSLSVYSYSEGNGKIYSTNDTAVAGKILEDISTGKAKKAEEDRIAAEKAEAEKKAEQDRAMANTRLLEEIRDLLKNK